MYKLSVVVMVVFLSGCATLSKNMFNDADTVATSFFKDISRSHRQEAYNKFAKGLSNTLSYDHFEDMLDAMQKQWGNLQDAESVELLFHPRPGESNFIPLRVNPDEIKRYVFEVQFNHAKVNWDLTLALQDGEYKIIWMSIWGSDYYFPEEIREKLQIQPQEELQ